MDSTLLATKLRIPPQSHQVLRRSRLVDALERGVREHKLVLISAPAGFGKTTLLADWARNSPLDLAWLSLGEEDNDIARFYRYLLTAWAELQPSVRESPLGLLLGAADPDSETVLSAFINVANDAPDQMVFVLDDYHLLTESSIHVALTFLLDHLPPTLHFVLAGRADPPLPLARYRARNELLELPAEDLQFQLKETAEFLTSLMGLDLRQDEIATLHTQLEGWIAGLQLASLTLRRYPEATRELVVSGRHRFIADFLSDDVLAQQSEEVRCFLLQTSILDRLCGALCDAVAEREASQEMLELLEREHLFLTALDERREWYRYHRLFAGFLQEQLQRHHADEVADLHRRAAQWYMEQDFPEEAFQHALRGADLDLVVQVLDRYLNVTLYSGELNLLQGWLDALPAGWYSAYPLLGLSRAGLLLFTGAFDDCVRCIDEVEQKLAETEIAETSWPLARVSAFRCFLACFQGDLEQAERHASDALSNLQQDDHAFRADIYQALGDTYRGYGRWTDARACYLQAMQFVQEPVRHIVSAHVLGALADLELRRGRLREAAGY